ncbi:DNA alkylation repair protein [Paractinoplanes maris]|uniref:DNA alkylation repair protein n=1 Tax=Paractinoplanes maris TaxID=1734446 RepID=UPI0020218ACD|nr:DNA alkylation repair protein [Actinoplanes maris]
MTDLTATLLDRLDERLLPAADPVRAQGQAAYMKDQFSFLGLPAPALRKLERAALAGLPPPSETDLRAIVRELWSRPPREYQYVACSYLVRHVAVPGPGFVPTLRELITTKSWWDTIDPLATRFTGGLVTRHPPVVAVMDEWSRDDNLWLVRTAILHQLHYGTATDTDRLFGYCEAQAGHRDFFVRKAIGWALRHYARTDPDAVRAFVETHRSALSGLSVREAMKHL